MTMLPLFDAIVRSRVPRGKSWPPPGDFSVAFALAGRTVGRAPLVLSEAEQSALRARGVESPQTPRSVDDAARIALLLGAAQRLPSPAMVALTEECFRQGDSRERIAILRALPFLPQPAGFVPLAVEACRTSIQPVFEAIACENPIPAAHFPELNFNQLVLKALFIGVPLERVQGLQRRRTPELSRMAKDYASERAAAGRSIPPDLARLTQDAR